VGQLKDDQEKPPTNWEDWDEVAAELEDIEEPYFAFNRSHWSTAAEGPDFHPMDNEWFNFSTGIGQPWKPNCMEEPIPVSR
jgi:ABC-type glycerol-3-phosphate transport system substrate-binding protein